VDRLVRHVVTASKKYNQSIPITMLTYRFKVMNDTVDLFVIVEGPICLLSMKRICGDFTNSRAGEAAE